MTTHDALLAHIIAHPEDDLARLAFADWCDENGQPERAAWVRVQCELELSMPDKVRPTSRQNLERHIWAKAVKSEMVFDWFRVFNCNSASEAGVGFIWGGDPMEDTPDGDVSSRATVRRGFVAEWRGPLAVWCGGECQRCNGDGMNHDVPHRHHVDHPPCPTCHGTGRTPGIGPAVVRAHPVERVVAADREADTIGDEFCWVRHREGLTDTDTGGKLPSPVLDLLKGGRHESAGEDWRERFGVEDDWVIFPTRELAMSALSAALIAWAKSQPVAGSG